MRDRSWQSVSKLRALQGHVHHSRGHLPLRHRRERTEASRLRTLVTRCFDCFDVEIIYSAPGRSERRSMASSLTDVKVAHATRRCASLCALGRRLPGFLRCAGGRLGDGKGTKKETWCLSQGLDPPPMARPFHDHRSGKHSKTCSKHATICKLSATVAFATPDRSSQASRLVSMTKAAGPRG